MYTVWSTPTSETVAYGTLPDDVAVAGRLLAWGLWLCDCTPLLAQCVRTRARKSFVILYYETYPFLYLDLYVFVYAVHTSFVFMRCYTHIQ